MGRPYSFCSWRTKYRITCKYPNDVTMIIAGGHEGFTLAANSLAVNGYGDLSPGGYSLASAFLVEVVLTAVFLIVILGATAKRAAAGMGGLAIGLSLTLIHLISIPVTNTSVNPARSTSQAIFAGTEQLGQLWMFWVAPILGAAIGALIHRYFVGDREDVIVPTIAGEPAAR